MIRHWVFIMDGTLGPGRTTSAIRRALDDPEQDHCCDLAAPPEASGAWLPEHRVRPSPSRAGWRWARIGTPGGVLQRRGVLSILTRKPTTSWQHPLEAIGLKWLLPPSIDLEAMRRGPG